MKSDLTCAFSGALLIFGGWAVVIWVFWRALALHLQICWEVSTGNKFFWTTLVVGWLIPGIGVTLTLTLTGVSYRFGNICHINHKNGLEDYWGPLLAFATLALVLQFITIGYCVNVYVRSLLDDKPTTENSSGVQTFSNATSARQAYRRVKRVVQLQWRGAMIVLLIIAEVIFFSVVFVSMDNSSQVNEDLIQRATPWVTCMVLTAGKKEQCLTQAQALVKNEAVVIAVLICLGVRPVFNRILAYIANNILDERFLASYLPRQMVYGSGLERLHPNQGLPTTTRIRFRRCETIHERSTYVRNARFSESGINAEHYLPRSSLESRTSTSSTKFPHDTGTRCQGGLIFQHKT